jgi:hypothetical protein
MSGFGSRQKASLSLFLLYISLLQGGWIFMNCYLYSALTDRNKIDGFSGPYLACRKGSCK